jgi:hypothetical protein
MGDVIETLVMQMPCHTDLRCPTRACCGQSGYVHQVAQLVNRCCVAVGVGLASQV